MDACLVTGAVARPSSITTLQSRVTQELSRTRPILPASFNAGMTTAMRGVELNRVSWFVRTGPQEASGPHSRPPIDSTEACPESDARVAQATGSWDIAGAGSGMSGAASASKVTSPTG